MPPLAGTAFVYCLLLLLVVGVHAAAVQGGDQSQSLRELLSDGSSIEGCAATLELLSTRDDAEDASSFVQLRLDLSDRSSHAVVTATSADSSGGRIWLQDTNGDLSQDLEAGIPMLGDTMLGGAMPIPRWAIIPVNRVARALGLGEILRSPSPTLQEYRNLNPAFREHIKEWSTGCRLEHGCDTVLAMLKHLSERVDLATDDASSDMKGPSRVFLENFRGMAPFAARLYEAHHEDHFDQLWSEFTKTPQGEVSRVSFDGRGPLSLLECCGLGPDQVEFMFWLGDLDRNQGLSKQEFVDYVRAAIETSGVFPLSMGIEANKIRCWAGSLSPEQCT